MKNLTINRINIIIICLIALVTAMLFLPAVSSKAGVRSIDLSLTVIALDACSLAPVANATIEAWEAEEGGKRKDTLIFMKTTDDNGTIKYICKDLTCIETKRIFANRLIIKIPPYRMRASAHGYTTSSWVDISDGKYNKISTTSASMDIELYLIKQ